MSYQRTSAESFDSKVRELMDISESLPPGEDQELLSFMGFNLDESFAKSIRQAVTSSMLAFAKALKDCFNDNNTSWRTDLEAFHAMASCPLSESPSYF